MPAGGGSGSGGNQPGCDVFSLKVEEAGSENECPFRKTAGHEVMNAEEEEIPLSRRKPAGGHRMSPCSGSQERDQRLLSVTPQGLFLLEECCSPGEVIGHGSATALRRPVEQLGQFSAR